MVDLNLDNKFKNFLENSSSQKITSATRDYNVRDSLIFEGKSCVVLNPIKVGDTVLIFKDNTNSQYYAVGSKEESSASTTLSERAILSRHGKPSSKRASEAACQILSLAFLYRIRKADKSQDFYLVDFNGNHRFLLTVPPATRYYHDATYTFQVTIPSYTYVTYELYYQFDYNLVTDSFISQTGFSRNPNLSGTDPLLSGTESSLVLTATLPYGESLTAAPNLQVQNISYTVEELWSRVEYPYELADLPLRRIPGNGRYFHITDTLGDNDDNFNWTEILPTGLSVPSVVFPSGVPLGPPFDLVPWREKNPAYEGPGQLNPEGESILRDGGTRLEGRVKAAHFFATNFTGSLSVFVPPGQTKPPPTAEFAEVETYMSYQDGSLKVLIRNSDRPSGIGPGDRGQPGTPGGPWFTSIKRFELTGSALAEIETTSLPNWMQLFSSSRTINSIREDYDQDTISEYEATLRYRLVMPNNSYEDTIIAEDRVKVDSGVNTVWGWHLDLDSIAESSLLGGSTFTVNYFIFPIHVIPRFTPPRNRAQHRIIPGGGGGLNETSGNYDNAELLVNKNTKSKQLEIKVKPFANAASLNPSELQIDGITANWSEKNTVFVCHDTSKIFTPPDVGSV